MRPIDRTQLKENREYLLHNPSWAHGVWETWETKRINGEIWLRKWKMQPGPFMPLSDIPADWKFGEE